MVNTPYPNPVNPDTHLARAKAIVIDTREKAGEPTDESQVYIVWFAKTLQNWKALLSTSVPDGKYYEVTHNGDKEETYVDTYAHIANAAVPNNNPSL